MSKQFRSECACGFQSNPTRSAAQATYALRQHSCDKHRALIERKAKGDAMRAAVDRTPKPCLHKIAQHQHGTRACYVLDKCRCVPCARMNAMTERTRQRQTAYGRWQPYVDAGPAREHVLQLRAQGMGLKRIAVVSGVAHGVLSKLIYGDPKRNLAPSKRVRWETAVRLMVVRVDEAALADGAKVDATGTRRRLQALVAIGWSMSRLAIRLGMNPTNLPTLMDRDAVFARTARAVAALYDELWDTPPAATNQRQRISVSRSTRYAAAREWAPPGAWADDDIDNPAAHPNATGYDPERVVAVMAGALLDGDEDLEIALTRVDRLEVLRRGRLNRWPTAETARQTGLPKQLLYADTYHARQRTGPAGQLPPPDELQFLLDSGESIATIASRFRVSEGGVFTALRRAPAA